MSKKRTSLDSILNKVVEEQKPKAPPRPEPPVVAAAEPPQPRATRQQSVYLGLPVYEQLRKLAFEERGKMHAYMLEGLDLVFRKRGLPGISELEKAAK